VFIRKNKRCTLIAILDIKSRLYCIIKPCFLKAILMKQLLLYSFLSIILFSSCEKEDDPIRTTPFQWPEGTSDYAPYTIGSTFAYELKTANPIKTDSFSLTVAKDTIINTLMYYKLVSNKPELQPTYFVNYNNGNLTEITYNLDYLGLGAIIVPVVLETTLKENLAVNETWSEGMLVQYPVSPTQLVDLNVTFGHTMIQKNFTKRVLDIDFANTIAVREVISTIIPPGFPWPTWVPTTSQFDNFYSKGAGLVQRDVSTGSTLKLKRYNIIK
jgi:hypothetical protein